MNKEKSTSSGRGQDKIDKEKESKPIQEKKGEKREMQADNTKED